MNAAEMPRVRPLELVPLESGSDAMFALRDPAGYAETVALPMGAAMLVTLMNGERTLGQLRQEFERQIGKSLTLGDVERVVTQLDQRHFLDNARFAAYQAALESEYAELDVRPAAHAGGAYSGEPTELSDQLAAMFTSEKGPGLLPGEGDSAETLSTGRLCGVMCPHIDFHRGGPTFAWAYDRVVAESSAEVFVVFGTAHTPLKSFYSVSSKHFDTPLGTTRTDREFIADLRSRLASSKNGHEAERIFDDEMPHRGEHSIEFQALMLQYVLGVRRNYTIVPILVGSFHPFVLHHRSPGDSPVVAEFIAALRGTIAECGREVCYVGGVDLAHIGPQFGDEESITDARLTEQWTDDQNLMAAACLGDPEAWFIHVAAQQDRNRICGLAPIYTMLEAMRPGRGELLRYDQAVAPDRSSCVSFAAAAFYE